MIGALIITHGRLAEALLHAAESITGKMDGVVALSVTNSDSTEALRASISSALRDAGRGEGVVIFTDMFGGTPTNIALSFLEHGKVEVITGVNLPMVLKFTGCRADRKIEDAAHILRDYGRESIVLAGDMLRERKQH